MPRWQGEDHDMHRTSNLGPRTIDYPDHYRPQINHSINQPHLVATPRNVLYSTPEISGHRRDFVGNRAPHNPSRHHHYTRQSGATEVDGRAGWTREDWDRTDRETNRHHVPQNHQEDSHQPHHNQPQHHHQQGDPLQNLLFRADNHKTRVHVKSLSTESSNPEFFWSATTDRYHHAMRDRWSSLTFSLILCSINEMRNPSKYVMFHFKPRISGPNAGGWLIFQLFPEKQVALTRHWKGEKPFVLLRTNSVGITSIREPDPDDTARSIIENLSSCLRAANGNMEFRLELVKEGAVDTLRSGWFKEPKHSHSLSTVPSPSISASSPVPSLRESTLRHPGASITTAGSSQPYKNNVVGSRVTGMEGWSRDIEKKDTPIATNKAQISEQPLREPNRPSFIQPEPAQETLIADHEIGPPLESKAGVPATHTERPLPSSPSASLEPERHDSEPPDEPLRKKAKPIIKQESESDSEPGRKKERKKKRRQIPVVDSDTDISDNPPRKKRKRLKPAEPELEKKKKSKSAPSQPASEAVLERRIPIVDSDSETPEEPRRKKKTKKAKQGSVPLVSQPEPARSKRKHKQTPTPPKTHPEEDLDYLQKRLVEINNAKNELFVEEQELKAKLLRQKFDQSKHGGSDGKSILHCTCSACGEYGHRKDSWKCPKHPGKKRVLG